MELDERERRTDPFLHCFLVNLEGAANIETGKTEGNGKDMAEGISRRDLTCS